MRQVLAASEVGLKGCDELEFVLNALGDSLKKRARTRPHTCTRFELLHGLHLRGESTRCRNRFHHGRWTLRQSHGHLGLPGLSGVGISFGADRIYDVLNQLELYPADTDTGVELLFINFGAAEAARCLELARTARAVGISTEVYPDAAKMKKQMAYANARHIPFVALIGENELQQGLVTLKNMATGEQSQLTPRATSRPSPRLSPAPRHTLSR